MAKGFHVPIKLEDQTKTAFVTPWGKYQYRHMAFRLRNGPSVFQRLMDIILHDVLYCFHAYIDDIVIYSGSWEDHCVHLVVVLEKLRDTGLILKTSKYERGIASCVYLGFVVGNGHRRPEECKVNSIKSYYFE